MNLKWEDPPDPKGRPVYDWHSIAADLIGQSCRWAIVATPDSRDNAGQVALKIRRADYDPLKIHLSRVGGEFEAVSRTVDGEHRVYARWIPNRT